MEKLSDSQFADLRATATRTLAGVAGSEARKRVHFDPTINLGHLLTFVGFIAAGFSAYSTLDKRLALQEERAAQTERLQREQEARLRDRLEELRAQGVEARRSIDDLSRAVAIANATATVSSGKK